MRNFLGKMGALAAGALVMYYFDPQSGGERRAALRGLLAGGMRQQVEAGRARRATRMRAYHRIPRSDPQSDARLRDEIQQRLGRMVSHPGAIEVKVEDGVVRLSGDVLTKERDDLLLQVQAMPGVEKLVNAMTAHDNPQTIASREAREEARGEPA